MSIIYAFPEPLPMNRARGLQAVSTVAALGRAGIRVEFAFVPVAGQDPFLYYGVTRPERVHPVPLSRSLAWPLSRIHSNRFFFANLRKHFGTALFRHAVVVRHLKLAALIAAHLPQAAMTYEAHEVFGDTSAGRRKEVNLSLERRVVSSARSVIANSAATAARLKALYGAPACLAVIPNGVDRPQKLPDKPWADARLNVVYSGSFFPWKGAAELVRAARQLPGYRLTMMGGDEARIGELRREVAADGAEVVFTGHLPHVQVMSRLSSACIAVLPNRDDTDSSFTSPIKLFEYMAAGCAIVASDLPALREILDDADAIWVKPGDATALAAGIRRVSADPSLASALGQRVRDKSAGYSWDARAEQLMAVLGAPAATA